MPAAPAQIQNGTSLVFVTTPNNPTGTAISIDDLRSFAQATKGVGALLVVDEAYSEFSPFASAVTLIEEFPHLAVCRTMSKAFAMAGARLGYLVADPMVIRAMHLVRLPYHLSSITQAVAELLDFRKELLATVADLKAGREWLNSELKKLGPNRRTPSAANSFFFCRVVQFPSSFTGRRFWIVARCFRDVGYRTTFE
jgi:histidinol-phosphate aminotransferase